MSRHTSRLTIDRLSSDYRPSVDWLSTECRPSVDRVSTATSTDIAVDIAVDATYGKHDPLVSKRDYLFEIQLQTETRPRVKTAHNLAAALKCQSVSLIFNEINAINHEVILISLLSFFNETPITARIFFYQELTFHYLS